MKNCYFLRKNTVFESNLQNQAFYEITCFEVPYFESFYVCESVISTIQKKKKLQQEVHIWNSKCES